MGRQRLPVVSENYLLLLDEGKGQLASILIESEDWYQWLATENNRSFAFRHSLGAFTVRRERKRHSWYWYAYHKRNGKLHKAYLGKSEEMTLQRLNCVATALGGLDNDVEAPVGDSFATPTLFHQERISISDQIAENGLPVSRRDFLKTAAALPVYLTPLLGREQEVQEVCSLLQRPEVRLLTLTGPGGIGKTRLSVQVATQLAGYFSDGVYFVPLASVSNPDLVIPTIAQVLGLREVGHA